MPRNSYAEDSRRSLDEVVRELEPLLEPIGYKWTALSEGASSGGSFANGEFVGPAGRVGLIWRYSSGLGDVTYGPHDPKSFQCSHTDVMRALGAEQDAHFMFNESKWAVEAKAGGSVTEALRHDLEHHTSRVLVQPPSVLKGIAEAAFDRWQRKLRGI